MFCGRYLDLKNHYKYCQTYFLIQKFKFLKELSQSWDHQTDKCEKNMNFWDYEFFPCSNPKKPPFSWKLEMMWVSSEKTATKKIKNKKVSITWSFFFLNTIFFEDDKNEIENFDFSTSYMIFQWFSDQKFSWHFRIFWNLEKVDVLRKNLMWF